MTATAFADRIVERAMRADLAVAPRELARHATYFELLRTWNRKINLTALPLDPPTDEALDRLFIEPLVAARWLAAHFDALPAPFSQPPAPSGQLPRYSWIDLGSGGGSPAVPMKIASPRLGLTMIESRSRKAAFLREVVRTLRLEDVEVANARFEDLADGSAIAQLVTVRAVRVDAELGRAAATLLVAGGQLLVFQSQQQGFDLPGFQAPVAQPLLSERHSWLLVYSRLFHVEH